MVYEPEFILEGLWDVNPPREMRAWFLIWRRGVSPGPELEMGGRHGGGGTLVFAEPPVIGFYAAFHWGRGH